MSVPASVPLRRDPEREIVAGVAAGLARRLGIDPIIVRVAFVATTMVGGVGLAGYLLGWALMPVDGSARAPVERIVARRDTWLIVAGAVCLAVAGLLLLRHWGLWFSDGIVWPVMLVAAGGALIWRQSTMPPEEDAPAPRTAGRAPSLPALRLPADALGRALVGAALVVGGGLVFLWLNDALRPARDVLLAVVVVVVALTLILAPWWLRLVRGLTAERAERIRSQERAEVAAHLHDSVLQTLALMQKRADDPREVAALARRQERELRAWLNGRRAPGELTIASCARSGRGRGRGGPRRPGRGRRGRRRAARRRAPRRSSPPRARRSSTPPSSRADSPVALYAEVAPERIEVFVRDRGPGFDPDRVPADRRGVRESIVGRMERHGGRAVLHTAPGEGTEVELVMKR